MSNILGQLGERLVQKFFEQQGWVCCDHNVSFREGELDLVFRQNGRLLFVEVKTRTSSNLDSVYPRISFQKIKRYQIAVFHYLEQHFCRSYEVRVVYVTLDIGRKHAVIETLKIEDLFY